MLVVVTGDFNGGVMTRAGGAFSFLIVGDGAAADVAVEKPVRDLLER